MPRDASNLAVEVAQTGSQPNIPAFILLFGPLALSWSLESPGKSPFPVFDSWYPTGTSRTYLRTYVQWRAIQFTGRWLNIYTCLLPSSLRLNSLDDCHDLLGISHVDLTRQLANRFLPFLPPYPVKFSLKFIQQPLKLQDTLARSLAATACRLIIVVELSSCGGWCTYSPTVCRRLFTL